MSNPSPFPTAAKSARRRTMTEIDPDLLVVEHDTPMPTYRSKKTDKYHQVFSKLKPGSCVRCQAAEKDRVSNALRKAVEMGKYPEITDCRVVSRTYPDGGARVWAMPAEVADKVAQSNQHTGKAKAKA